ncbi:MAG: hypothetical protein R3F60_33375 [bacterium]
MPPERRTFIAELAARRFAQGALSRGRFCEYLEVSRAEEVERVVDYFGFTCPVARRGDPPHRRRRLALPARSPVVAASDRR